MATRAYSKSIVITPFDGIPRNVQNVDYYNESSSSLRKPGKGELLLKPQPHVLRSDKLTDYQCLGPKGAHVYDIIAPQSASVARTAKFPPGYSTAKCDNIALAKWNGRIRYGGTSLGITIAQWGQSNSMILSRFGKLNQVLLGTERRLERNLRTKSGRRRFKRDRALGRNPRYTRRTRDPLANQVLEYEFGWAPLVKDLVGACTSLFTDAIPDNYVRASHTIFSTALVPLSNQSFYRADREYTYSTRCTLSANVKIENPNLWLANRAGLINLPGIVWDAIPWSFLVGMFVNVNQLLGQLTNEAGLSITDRSTTRLHRVLTVEKHWKRQNATTPYTHTWSKLLYKERTRTVGSFPTVSLQFKCPDLNPELILIACALAVQRFKNISKLLDLSHAATRRF